jgi:hypothetical protein
MWAGARNTSSPRRQMCAACMLDRVPFTAIFHYPVYRALSQECPNMKSKLLKKITYGVIQSREVVNGQQKHTEGSSVPWRARENPPGRVSRPVEALDHKALPVS